MLRDEDLFRRLIDAAPDAMVVMDAQGRVVFVNSQCERLFGYPRDALIGQAIEVLLPDRLRAAHVGHRAQFTAAPKVRPMGSQRDLAGRRSDGSEFPVEISLSPLEVQGGLLVSAAIRDISERKRMEAEAQLANERMRAQAEAGSAAKSEFLASMSHELRTPLNAILGFAQLLRRDKRPALVERQLGQVDHILRGGEHLLRLIDDVLDLARIEAGRVTISIEPVGVAEVLESVITTLGPMAAHAGVHLQLAALPEDLPKVGADRTRFAQVLINYGSNAIKYGRPAGRVEFQVTRPSDGEVRVSVVDEGMGIPLDRQDKIFQPFHRAGQETGPIEGTGIGLAISRRLADMMGGRVGFRSAPGEGSAFWIELPVYAQEGAEPDPARPGGAARSSSLSAPSVARSTVVYIEDNPANVAFMEHLMAEFPQVELLSAPNAEIGVELVRARRPQVVIMDINLPGMSGIEALRRLRAQPETEHIPVIALSAAVLAKDLGRAREAGFYRYLTKPVRVDELISTLEELL